MTADAELLAGATMATRAGGGLEARARSVLAAARGQPPGGMWTRRRGAGSDAASCMAVDAGALGVTGRANTGVGARFLGVARCEARAVKPRDADVVEGEAGGERGDRALAVARGALPLGMTARA